MRRADAMQARTAVIRTTEQPLPLTWGDAVLSAFTGLAALYLILQASWLPGAKTSALVFATLSLGLLALRGLSARFPKIPLFGYIASFWLIPCAILGHFFIEPVVDAFRPELVDSALAAADLRIFGAHPSVVLGALTPTWAVEFLLFCYYSYFLWPFILGALFFVAGRRDLFNQFLLAISLFFALNFVGYVLVPAIGPRFFLADEFAGPLQGLWFTSTLDGMMRGPTFLRDCFPSGHTGITLVTLAYGARYHRKFFAVMLIPGSGLILATLVGRFHYGIDLMCSVPLAVAVISIASALEPLGVRVAEARRQLARPRFPARA